MSFKNEIHLHDPKEIRILRDKRQRRIFTLDDLKESIPKRGLINPIICRRAEDGVLELIAGERRLTTYLELPELGPIPVRYSDELSPIEAQIIELEENLKRQDLSWIEYCDATLTIHELYAEADDTWTLTKTGESLGLTYSTIYRMIEVAKAIKDGNERLTESSGWNVAYQSLENQRSRARESADQKLASAIASDFAEVESYAVEDVKAIREEGEMEEEPSVPSPRKEEVPPPILNTDAIAWMEKYSGVPFNLLHCDFPYGINIHESDQAHAEEHGTYEDTPEVYWALLGALCSNLNQIMSPHAHMIFWHSPKMGEQTRDFFEHNAPDLWVQDVPLIWLKSDNRGIIADAQRRPRNITEFAFLVTRGDRKLLKSVANGYAAPTSRAIHQAEKPVPVLKHFFQMLVDEHTRMLDPTSGSANSLIAASDFKAGQVLGLEKDPDFFERSVQSFKKYLTLKQLSEQDDE